MSRVAATTSKLRWKGHIAAWKYYEEVGDATSFRLKPSSAFGIAFNITLDDIKEHYNPAFLRTRMRK